MVSPPGSRTPRPKTFCPACKQHGIVVVKLPDGKTMCFRCIRSNLPIVYQNITRWVLDNPPITQEEPTPGG